MYKNMTASFHSSYESPEKLMFVSVSELMCDPLAARDWLVPFLDLFADSCVFFEIFLASYFFLKS